MKAGEITKCAVCGQGIMHEGMPIFWRVTCERMGLDLAARIAAWQAQGVAPMPELRDLKPMGREARERFGWPYNAPTGADEEEG